MATCYTCGKERTYNQMSTIAPFGLPECVYCSGDKAFIKFKKAETK